MHAHLLLECHGAMDLTQVWCIDIFRTTWWRWEIVCWRYMDLMVHSKWENGFHCHTHQVWHRQKLSTTFDLQGMRMILSECEDCGVKSLGGDHFWMRHDTDFLCPVGGTMDITKYWCTDIFRATPSTLAKDLNGRHSHGQQVWRRRKLFIKFHLQGQTMILTDCEVCGVESVGGGREIMRYSIISKWRPNS